MMVKKNHIMVVSHQTWIIRPTQKLKSWFLAANISNFLVWLKHIFNKRLLNGHELRKFSLQLWSIKLIVAPWSNNHLSLFFKSEVFPGKAWINILLIHLQDLIMTDHSRIGEVINTSQIPLGHFDRNRKQLIQNSHGIWYIHHLIIPCNLGNKVTRICQIGWDRHPNTQCTNIVIVPEQILYLSTKNHKSEQQ